MSAVISLVFTSVAFSLVLVVLRQVKADCDARVAALQAEFRHQVQKFRNQIEKQLDGIDVTAINKETDGLRAEISSLRRRVNQNFDQRGEIEKAAMGISQLWSEVYRLRHDTASAIIDYSTGTSSTANNSSSGTSQPQLTNRRTLVANTSKPHHQFNSDSSSSGNSFAAISKPHAKTQMSSTNVSSFIHHLLTFRH